MRVDRTFHVAFSLVCLVVSIGFAPTSVGQDGGKSEENSAEPVVEPLNDIKILAQQAALPSLKGEDKFILRESWWSGSIAPGRAKLIQVQLFQRNAYRFWLAVPDEEAELNLNVYDSEGVIVPAEFETYGGSHLVSVTVEPDLSGVYYVRLSLKTTIDRPQDWAVIYAWK